MKKWLILRAGAEKVKDEEHPVVLQNNGDIPKGLRSPREGVPIGQIWDNFDIKIKNASIGLYHTQNGIGIHKSILYENK